MLTLLSITLTISSQQCFVVDASQVERVTSASVLDRVNERGRVMCDLEHVWRIKALCILFVADISSLVVNKMKREASDIYGAIKELRFKSCIFIPELARRYIYKIEFMYAMLKTKSASYLRK